MIDERDDSYDSIMERYRSANEQAIVTVSKVVFESLMDIPRLVKRLKSLELCFEESLHAHSCEVNALLEDMKKLESTLVSRDSELFDDLED